MAPDMNSSFEFFYFLFEKEGSDIFY